ncbi:hypothetical protein [Buchnera aphidicola]|uniref:hypothetical protein n=1 Tax=Buchnera aphidicola TaxID=9 RepID=UPI003464B1C4
MILNGIRNSAILFMLIGIEETIKILNFFKTEDIQNIMTAMLSIDIVSQEKVYNILNQFIIEYNKISGAIYLDHDSYISSILLNHLNKKKIDTFSKTLLNKKKFFAKIKLLNYISAKDLFFLLKNESLYFITTILLFLEIKHTKNIISYFPDDKKSEIIYSMTNFQGLQESKIPDLIKVINFLLDEKKNLSFQKIGCKTAIELFHTMKEKSQNIIMMNVIKFDKSIGEKFFLKTFTFEKSIYLTDTSILLLSSIFNIHYMILSLYYAHQLVKKKFFKNIPNLQEYVLNVENYNYPISNNIILTIRKKIVFKIQKLLLEKKISIIL